MLPADPEMEKIGRERVISLVFGLLGVIQGLAFTQLAEKIPVTFKSSEFNIDNLSKILYFGVGFFIVVRVFQTYSSGIVSYARRQMKIWDLYAIFITGLLQYWVFTSFGADGIVDSEKLFFRVMFLSVLAIILHIIVIASTKTPLVERSIQKINIGLAFGIFVSCLTANWINNQYCSIFFAFMICAMLFANTWNSMNKTDFGETI